MYKKFAKSERFPEMLKSEYFLGLIAGISVVLIWSFWLVVTRSGVSSTLTIFDFAAFRYGLSSLIALPFVLYFKQKMFMIYKYFKYVIKVQI